MKEAAYFQSLIGVLRWIIELGKVDIFLEASMTSSRLDLLIEEILNQLCHMLSHVKKHHDAQLVFDSSDDTVDSSRFESRDCTSSEFNHILKEMLVLPRNIPHPS